MFLVPFLVVVAAGVALIVYVFAIYVSGTVLVDVAVAGDVVGGVEVVTAVADVGTVAFGVVYEVVAVAVSGAVVVNVLVETVTVEVIVVVTV